MPHSSLVQVLIPQAVNQCFTYQLPEHVNASLGNIVQVPFGKRTLHGVIWEMGSPKDQNTDASKTPRYTIKSINAVMDHIPALTPELMQLITWTATYYMAPLGSVLAMTLNVKDALKPPATITGYRLNPTIAADTIRLTPQREGIIQLLRDHSVLTASEIREQTGVSQAVITGLLSTKMIESHAIETHSCHVDDSLNPASVTLSPDQASISQQLVENTLKEQFNVTVLDGLTGSGKTEVYCEAIEASLQQGKQVLVLVPEIVLTSQLLTRLSTRFGFTPSLWHSSVTPKQRRETWLRIANGHAKLIVGARSALFLPYRSLGLIVVDEEHETTYKQEEGVCYHARDMAVKRAYDESIATILVSASPSIESLVNVRGEKYQLLHLPRRYGNATLPDVDIIDMRKQSPESWQLQPGQWLSAPLREQIAHTLSQDEQSLLYLNRRGYAPLTLCRACGHRFMCDAGCQVWMVEHRPKYNSPYLQCHHCGSQHPVPSHCPACQSEKGFVSCGPGVERLAQEVEEAFPDARILCLTSDNMTSVSKMNEAISSITRGDVDIIIGTQLIAKGHHFPNLTLVGIVDADLGLEGGDIRASERTFQLLYQVAGRAGRSERKGQVLLQSYMPEHRLIQAIKQLNHSAFIETEIAQREQASMPPYSRLAAIVLSSPKEDDVKKAARLFGQHRPRNEGIRILGPVEAPLYVLRGKYRYRFLVIADKNAALQRTIADWLNPVKIPSSVHIKIDVDPYSFV